ncbi:hypothetical protein RUM44_005151 [Polyplax serrata]|uniref:Malate dehydrogenase 1B n=1 Tax=Polyplax serrata TaxID=468196 RepID=A0ABR1AFJ2_POLSC
MHFVIAGKINCPQFTYAVMVAQRLKENLPAFTYLKIPKQPDDWEKWLIKICKENEWYHVQSPLIWREFGLKMGKKQFIGDINRFLDLCYDYYGIPRGVLAADEFSNKEMNWFKTRTESEYFEDIKLEAAARREYKSRQVCITGASSQITEILIMEILKIHGQSREGGLEIRLFDETRKESKLRGSAFDAKYCPGLSGFGNCRVATTLKEALLNVDLVIVLDTFSRKPKESLVKWLKRNRNAMCALGKGLNMYAHVHCRVIIGSPSNQPLCYNATVLASFATKLHVRNIVVVTQDLGREMLKSISSKTRVALRDLYCPPVWGFVGLNKFIDVCKTLQTNIYKVPGKHKNSTLPQGTEEFELRTLDCMLSEEDTGAMQVHVSNLKLESFPHLGRWPCLAKATAIVDLLKLWGLKQEDGNGEIICLGVYSDGTFNIPHGLYWSQPVILKNGFWVPFPDYPIPRPYHFNCYYFFIFGLAALYRTKIKPRRYVPPKRLTNARTKKFDFDKIMEETSIPVITTDPDSVTFLKYIVKNELGIDFDTIDNTLVEESEPEEMEAPEVVEREDLYCECWREELKELQKIVFYRSSSSEVEVDLSDNVSGSEWSVINVDAPLPLPVTVTETASPKKSIEILPVATATSSSTVCSCGALSNGSICQCLGTKKSEEETTEHFYIEQNAEVFQDDQKDVIYEDAYAHEKRVSFDPNEKSDGTGQLPKKFYGRKDAIRDEAADLKMKKRIMRYERNLECGDGEESSLEDSLLSSSEDKKEDEREPKFHIPIEGTAYDIIGDPDGLESLEVRRNATASPSLKSFREMYTDEVVPQLQMLPPPLQAPSATPSDSFPSVAAEDNGEYSAKYVIGRRELGGEDSVTESLGEAVDAIYERDMLLIGESENGLFHIEEFDDGVSEVEPKIPKWKREGLSLCCLCRCVLPEGLPCCPCGSTTVVEVFKKESIEVIVQSEDDISYRMAFKERFIQQTSETESSIESEETEKTKKSPRDLPPESFFPFSPKHPNKFFAEERPLELTNDYLKSFTEKPETEIPQKCVELLNLAKDKLNKELEMKELKRSEMKKVDEEMFAENCTTEELPIKTDFSNLNLFTLDGIEDWRLSVQIKYRNWFFQGPKIRDESYYDVAIEEISDDEFECDKELELYFEK